MKYFGRAAVFTLASLALLALVVVGLRAVGLGADAVFAPAEEEVRREVYKESSAKRDGTVRELSRLRREYANADSGSVHRAMIRADAIRIFEVYGKPRELPDDLRRWVQRLRQQR
jgi:hypothetical protein